MGERIAHLMQSASDLSREELPQHLGLAATAPSLGR